MQVARLAVEDYAIVAGINYYPYFSPLQGAVGDAMRFANWLRASAFVPEDQVYTVTTPQTQPPDPEDAQPQLDEIKSKFEHLARIAFNSDCYRAGRRLYIFLSGHGILPTRSGAPDYEESALLMANTDRATLGNHLGGRAYAEWFRAPGVFDEVVLFMDCCRDWEDNIGLTPPSMPPIEPKRDAARRFYALATQLDSKSYERPFGAPPEVRGVFSSVLMESLESPGVCDANGLLTGTVLAGRLVSDMLQQSKRQIPDPEYSPQADIIFARRPAPPKITVSISFPPGVFGQTVELYGRKYPVPDDTHVADAQAWTKSLDPGLYLLKAPSAGVTQYLPLDGKQENVSVQFP